MYEYDKKVLTASKEAVDAVYKLREAIGGNLTIEEVLEILRTSWEFVERKSYGG